MFCSRLFHRSRAMRGRDLTPRMEPMESRTLLSASHYRIEVGGDALVEASGKAWQADAGFTDGVAVAGGAGGSDIAGTAEDRLFDTRRIGNFSYALRLNNGAYRVKMLFADPDSAPGHRRFDVYAERRRVLKDFDVAGAGGTGAAVQKNLTVRVRDGRLNLWFVDVAGGALLSGLEITPIVAAPATGGIAWSPSATAPFARFEAMGATVRNRLYVIGGFFNEKLGATRRVDRFDPRTGWKRMADLPEALTHSGVAVDGETIWVIGGYPGSQHDRATDHVWKYDIPSNTWSAGPSLPAPRGGGAAAIVGRNLHFISGNPGDSTDDRPEHYYLKLDRPRAWYGAADYPMPVTHLAAVTFNDKIYTFGGEKDWQEGTSNQSGVFMYDPATNKWSPRAPMPRPRSHFNASTFAAGNKIYAIGGSTNDGVFGKAISDVDEYDPLSDTWRSLTPLPRPLKTPVAGYLRGNVYVTTGSLSSSDPPTDATFVGVFG
jgi:N-acetylneuraminic acid mutarotase